MVGSEWLQVTIRHSTDASGTPDNYSMNTDTHTNTQYLIFIVFPRHQWLRKRVSMLRYTYIASLVRYKYGNTTNV